MPTSEEPRKGNLWSDAEFDADYTELRKRGLRVDTCKLFRYKTGRRGGKPVQVAEYIQDGQVVNQKVRFKDKDFLFLGGNGSKAPLYGQHLWKAGGKMLVITEGEIDALSVSQAQGNKWPVVSVPNGAQGAHQSIKHNLEWVQSFDKVIFMFDMDNPGREAAHRCAELLAPGKAHIAQLPLKDPNEMLQAGQADKIVSAIWNATPYRPDGVVLGVDTWDLVEHDVVVESVPYCWDFLNDMTLGLRGGEVVTIAAGSGIGKSTIAREVYYDLIKRGEPVGIIALEESLRHTVLSLMSLELSVPLHITTEGVTQEDRRRAWEATSGREGVALYDHWGSSDSDVLLAKMRYFAKGLGCRWLVLDHVSIVVSGQEEGDERRLIDNLMTKVRALAEETGVGIILVSHLKRPPQKGHEEGAQTSLSQLRGSAAIGQLSDIVIGGERDQQGEHPHLLALRILKNRFNGRTGIAGHLKYDHKTGRLTVADPEVEENFEDHGEEATQYF